MKISKRDANFLVAFALFLLVYFLVQVDERTAYVIAFMFAFFTFRDMQIIDRLKDDKITLEVKSAYDRDVFIKLHSQVEMLQFELDEIKANL